MALISFGYRVDMYAIAPPTELGAYIVAYDLDGILKQKDHLGIVSLVGSGTSGSSGSSGTSGVDGIVGGQLFYFNESVAGYTASYKELGNSPVISSEEIVTKTLAPTESNVLMSSYISDSLGLTVVPGGVQRFSLHYLKGSSQSNISTYAVVQLANENGDKYYDLGATQAIAYSNTQEIGWQNGNVVNISLDIISITTEILETDRIVISLYTNNLDTTTQSVSFYTEGSNNYSYVQTSTAVVPGPQGATGHGVTSSFYLQGTNDYSYDTTSDIYRTGSLAIGTSGSSTSKLHVYATQSGAFKLEDGSQGDSYILTSDASGVATWTASVPFLTGSYSVIRTLVDNSQLIPEKQYVINDYVHKYYIENTNTSNIKHYKTVTSRISNFLVLDGDYEYDLTVGMTITIESLPIGYSGSLIVGQTTTVTEAPSSYYFRFANGMHSTSTSIGVVISFGLPRFETLTGLIGTTVSDANLKVVMKPGGLLNTDVHDGTIYGDMSALENFAPPTEKLLLRARTSNTFYEEAESLTFKNDKVIYDINDSIVLNDNLEVISTRNGFVGRRFNEVLGIDINKDWRAQKYRRWLLPTEYRDNLLNLTLGTSSLNSNQDKYLYTSELLGTASNGYMYLGKSLETTDITLAATSSVTSGSILSYGVTFSTNQINFKDYPIFKLDSNLAPVKVSKVKIDNLSNSVFIGNTTNFNYDLYLELTTLSESTFQGNIVFFGTNIRLSNINSLSDLNIDGSFITFDTVNFLSTITANISDTTINNSIFGSMKFGVFLSGYGSLPNANTQVRWFTLFLYNSTIGSSVLGCGFSTLNISYSKINGITLFKYGGTLDIKNTEIGDFTIPNSVQYKSLLVQDYVITDTRLLNKDILVTSNINNFIVKTDVNGILYYDNIDIITGLPTKFYYNDTTKLYTPINSGSTFYIQGGTSSAYNTTSDIYRTGTLNIGTGTATDGRFVVSSATGSVSLIVDNTGSVYNISRGLNNTLFGYKALYSNTTGSQNTVIGYNALNLNSIGNNNVAIGSSSLLVSTSGSDNVSIGQNSMMSNTFGGLNVAIGSGVMVNNTSGQANVAIGVSALLANTSGANNVAIGAFALFSSVTGTNSTAIGFEALRLTNGGVENTAVGYHSLRENTTGSDNTSIGYNSLRNNTTGSYNVAVGPFALGSGNTTSSESVAIGYESLFLNTSVSRNTAVGYQSMRQNTTGYYNVSFGHQSLKSNTSGEYNTAIGRASLFSNTVGIYNTAVGADCLISITSGQDNTVIGAFAMNGTQTGSQNVAIGLGAGRYFGTGFSNNLVCNSSVFIGHNAVPLAGSQTNQIVIGAGAVGNGSNTVTLGNNNITRTVLKGNIGAGTASPSTKLHVYGTQSGAFRLEDGTQAAGYILKSDINGVGTWGRTDRLFNFASNTYQTVSGTISATSSAISSTMFGTGDVLKVQSIITLSAASTATASISYFINSTPSLSGATQIATYDGPINNRVIWTDRNFWSVGGTFNARNFGNSSQTSVSNSSSALGSVAIPSTFYILVVVTTTGTDLACISSVVIQKL
jgi:hypothetical protein